jgi:hypothetical protein
LAFLSRLQATVGAAQQQPFLHQLSQRRTDRSEADVVVLGQRIQRQLRRELLARTQPSLQIVGDLGRD